jgi:hypothetical protein
MPITDNLVKKLPCKTSASTKEKEKEKHSQYHTTKEIKKTL